MTIGSSFVGALVAAALIGGADCACADDAVQQSGFEPCEASLIPVATAGLDQVSGITLPIELDGGGSCDVGNVPLTFRWELLDRPPGSAAHIVHADAPVATITPDVPGSYRIRLIVDNGADSSLPDEVLLRAFLHFGSDSDEDGLSDALENSLGLDPYDADSFGDGVRDGDRDLDLDGLTILQEVRLGTDPINPDTNGNAINDGIEDFDQDGLSNQTEFAIGTAPLSRDTDHDMWMDGIEVESGTNPLDPLSLPRFLIATSSERVVLDNGPMQPRAVTSEPRDGIVVHGPQATRTVAATPYVSIEIHQSNAGTVVAEPPVQVRRDH